MLSSDRLTVKAAEAFNASLERARRSTGLRAIAAAISLTLAVVSTPQAQGLQPEPKSPTQAAVLNFLIPGVGNFYADNDVHGEIHLGIDLIAVGVLLQGAVRQFHQCFLKTCDTSEFDAAKPGLVIMALNAVVAVFTGIADAKSYNEKLAPPAAGRAVGGVHFDSQIRVLPSYASDRSHARTGLQFASIRF